MVPEILNLALEVLELLFGSVEGKTALRDFSLVEYHEVVLVVDLFEDLENPSENLVLRNEVELLFLLLEQLIEVLPRNQLLSLEVDGLQTCLHLRKHFRPLQKQSFADEDREVQDVFIESVYLHQPVVLLAQLLDFLKETLYLLRVELKHLFGLLDFPLSLKNDGLDLVEVASVFVWDAKLLQEGGLITSRVLLEVLVELLLLLLVAVVDVY